MKRNFSVLMLILCVMALVVPMTVLAEGEEIAPAVPTEPFSWEYLVTVTGAAAFTLLVAQFLKFPLDKVWKIPTRVLVYIIALMVMLIATAFTTGLTPQGVMLACANAFIAALTAMGAYEMTFVKLNKTN